MNCLQQSIVCLFFCFFVCHVRDCSSLCDNTWGDTTSKSFCLLILVAARMVFSFAQSTNLTPCSLSRLKDHPVCVGLQQCAIFFIGSVGYIARVECYVAHWMGYPCELISHVVLSDGSVSWYVDSS